jgi:hypothetical protein
VKVVTDSPSSLAGVLERVIFLNEENYYTIAEFRREDTDEKVTIVGALPGVQCGETLRLRGRWTRHSQHGDQFKVETFTSELPSSVHGIRRYLGSGLVPGIGRVYANKIVDAFGADTFRVLSEESARLRRVPGIGPKRAAAIKRAWDEQRALREIHIFLQTYGVTTSQCVKLVNRYGARAKQVLLTEPYRRPAAAGRRHRLCARDAAGGGPYRLPRGRFARLCDGAAPDDRGKDHRADRRVGGGEGAGPAWARRGRGAPFDVARPARFRVHPVARE